MKANENRNTLLTPPPCTNSDRPVSSTALQRPRQELGNEEHLKDLNQVHKTGNETNKERHVCSPSFILQNYQSSTICLTGHGKALFFK